MQKSCDERYEQLPRLVDSRLRIDGQAGAVKIQPFPKRNRGAQDTSFIGTPH
jgi:hypothetical protein